MLHADRGAHGWQAAVSFDTYVISTALQIVVRHRMHHESFERVAGKLLSAEPPCCSDAEDWEDAGGWAVELDALADAAAQQPPAMPLDPGAASREWSGLRCICY
jgi:hypothetical protein